MKPKDKPSRVHGQHSRETMGQRWGYEQSRMCGEVWISGQVRDGTGRWEAGCVLVKGEFTDAALEDIVARLPDLRCPRDVELRRVSCGIQGR